MKKKTLLLLFVFFISISNTQASISISKENGLGLKVGKLESTKNNKDENNDEIEPEIKKKKINFKDKKILKKQIQKRKRYHKGLLSLYNENFEEKYLNLITNNGIIISSLKKYYDYNYNIS